MLWESTPLQGEQMLDTSYKQQLQEMTTEPEPSSREDSEDRIAELAGVHHHYIFEPEDTPSDHSESLTMRRRQAK